MIDLSNNALAAIIAVAIAAYSITKVIVTHRRPTPTANGDKLIRELAQLDRDLRDLQNTVADLAAKKDDEEWPPVAVPGGSLREVAK